MTRTSPLIFAVLLSSSAVVPAIAAWDPVGSVNFTNRDTHDAKLGNFKGTAVGLTARDSDVMCDRVTATFGDGRSRQIFRGELLRGQTMRVGLPGSQRSIDRVDFDCRPTGGRSATVDIAADDGRGFGYRQDYYGREQDPDNYRRQQNRDYYGRQQNPDYDNSPQNPDYYRNPQNPNYPSQNPGYYSDQQNPNYYGSQDRDPYSR